MRASTCSILAVLTVALSPLPAAAQGAITNGENHTGSISAPGQVDVWTFSGTAGDAISLRIGEVGENSPYWPWIRLFAPNGTQLGSHWGQLAASINATAAESGTYTVWVASNDTGNDETGNYQLTMAKTPGAFVVPAGDQGGAMTNGANHTGTIHRADLDQWTFTAGAGDAISLRIGEVGANSAFWPWIRLRAPNGDQLGSHWGQLAASINVTAPAAGTYTVLVASNDTPGQEAGDYQLTLALTPGTFVVPPGDQGGPMTNGANHTGTIHRADLDQWTFTAGAGDAISLRIGEVGANSAFWPWIRLRAPNGNQLGSHWGQLAASINVTAPAAGTYTVLVASNDTPGQEAGDYQLTLALTPGTFVVPPGDQGGPMTNGANHTGTIHRADLDQWTFTANAGDAIALRIGEVGADSAFWPWIRLRAPNGDQLGSHWGQLAASINVTAPAAGTYTVLVASNDTPGQEPGDYQLTLAKTPGGFIVPPGDQGGPMTAGVEHTGTIHRADIDQWTLTVPAGATLRVNVSEVGANGPFWPWIRLRGPNGAQLGSHWGQTAAQIEITAPSAGLYTILVASNDTPGQETGDYLLTATVIGVTFTVTPSAGPNGAISPSTPQSVPSGETRSFTLTPSAGYRISNVSGTCGGNLAGQVFTTNPVTANCSVIGNFAPLTQPTLSLDKTSLQFAAVTAGSTFVTQTPAQVVRLTQNGTGAVTWNVAPDQPWLQVSPASGSGSANLVVTVAQHAALPPSGAVGGSVVLTVTGASNNPGPVAVVLNLLPQGTSQLPFGTIDTPTDNRSGVTGAIPFTGWAMDDVGIARVMVCRAAFGAEVAPADPNCGGAAQFFVGFAVSIDGARPDVAAAFPSYPANTAAGWGFMVLTNMLPNQGNGSYTFFLYAQDHEGHTTLLGTRTMNCANAQATLPFGAIDTPTQGGVASGGAYVNFGWALTPQPKMIPVDGSTITVMIDGVPSGNPVYNNFRGDIAFLFPGLQNTDGAVGFRVIDTTALANGTHTISWVVTDNAGATEGIGSRFFTVSNGAAATASAGPEAAAAGLMSSRAVDLVPMTAAPLDVRRGWNLELPSLAVAPSRTGTFVVRGEEIDRFELNLGDRPGSRYSGHLRTEAGLASLPIGSRLDQEAGTFTWAPGVGFVGSYDLVFVRWEGTAALERRDVRIIIQPKLRGTAGPQVVIDTPAADRNVQQPFGVAGWAADLDAATGTGIETLHVWAYPASGGSPVFLGAAAYGGRRADVAAAHGHQFADSGYGLTVQGLPAGVYDLAVFAWSTERGDFVPARTVRISVR